MRARVGNLRAPALSTAGRYRLFLQFKTAGVVHTAPFSVDVRR
jgi:hypothetical protein